MKFTATVNYINIATGFWALISESGEKYRPLNMPEILKKDGLKVQIEAKQVEDSFSIFMWGLDIEIIKFQLQ